MAKLGYIGLGVMGGNMVDRLLDKGHTVTGYNRTKSKAQWLIDKGMKWADTPAAVCAASDVILSMVTNSGALTEVAEGPNGVLAGIGAGKVWIDMSTVSPALAPHAGREGAREGLGHGGRPGLRQRDHFAARKTFGDGGRPRRDLRTREAAARSISDPK